MMIIETTITDTNDAVEVIEWNSYANAASEATVRRIAARFGFEITEITIENDYVFEATAFAKHADGRTAAILIACQ